MTREEAFKAAIDGHTVKATSRDGTNYYFQFNQGLARIVDSYGKNFCPCADWSYEIVRKELSPREAWLALFDGRTISVECGPQGADYYVSRRDYSVRFSADKGESWHTSTAPLDFVQSGKKLFLVGP
jgi:hypothetical protein